MAARAGAASAAVIRRNRAEAIESLTVKGGGSPGVNEDVEGLIKSELDREAPKKNAEGHWLIDHRCFKGSIAALVLMNTITMGFEADNPEYRDVMAVLENIYTSIFCAEMLAKLVVLKFQYFTDSWNLLDGSLVWMSIIDIWLFPIIGFNVDLQALSILRILRLFRLVRVLRLIRQFRDLALVIQGVISAMQTTFWVASVLLIAIYVGAIFCRSTLDKRTTEGRYPGWADDLEAIDETEMMMNFNPHVQFGSVPRAMLTLFNVAILAEWGEVVWPIAVKQPYLVIFFVFFVCFVTFGIMNVIIGMIVDSVMADAAALQRQESDLAVQRKKDTLQGIHAFAKWMSRDQDGFVNMEEMGVILRWLQAGSEALDDPKMIEFEMEQKAQDFKDLFDQIQLPRGCTSLEFQHILDSDGDGAITCDEFVQCFYRLLDSGEFQQRCLVQIGINECKLLVNRVLHEQQEARSANEERLGRLERMLQRALPADPKDGKQACLEEVVPPFVVLQKAAPFTAADMSKMMSMLETFGMEVAQRAVEQNGTPGAPIAEAKQISMPQRWSDAEDMEVVQCSQQPASTDPLVAQSGHQVICALFGADVKKLGLEVQWSPGPCPIVGVVEHDSAAWLQGLRPGDQIAACNQAKTQGRGRSDVLADLQSRPLELRAERSSM